MSRAERQKRWRDTSAKQRVEVYLPTETVAALDAMEGTRAEAITALLEGEQPSTGSRKPYRFRRPKAGDPEADWIMLIDGKPWAEVERYEFGWRARTIKRSLTWKWCKGKRRDEVAARLFDKPDIWQ